MGSKGADMEKVTRIGAPEPRVQRMLQEAKELNIRIMAATAFIEANPQYEKLEYIDQELLKAQTMAMQSYFNILACRIERATD